MIGLEDRQEIARDIEAGLRRRCAVAACVRTHGYQRAYSATLEGPAGPGIGAMAGRGPCGQCLPMR